jgi:hypothetical protein
VGSRGHGQHRAINVNLRMSLRDAWQGQRVLDRDGGHARDLRDSSI